MAFIVPEMRAPSLPGWQFFPCRQPVVLTDVAGLMTGRVGRWITDIQLCANLTDRNAIDVVFISDAFRGKDRQHDVSYCFALCETLLGQEILEEWIGQISTRPAAPNLLERAKALFGQATRNEASDLVPIDQMQERVHRLREAALSKLADAPLWRLPEDEMNRNAGVLQFTRPGSRRVTCSSTMPQTIVGAIPPPRCYSSARFSKFGETFCYLKIDESKSTVTEDSLDRGQLEDAFDAALKRASVGCVTGGGWGPVFNFIDFALADVERAIPVLRQTSSELGLPKETWLRFLDSKLAQEWVGMQPDTPEADLSHGW